MMDFGVLVGLILSLLPYFGLVAAVGGLSTAYLMRQRRKNESTLNLDDLPNITDVLNVPTSMSQKMSKLTTLPRLDMTKLGTNSLTDYSVNGRISKSSARDVI